MFIHALRQRCEGPRVVAVIGPTPFTSFSPAHWLNSVQIASAQLSSGQLISFHPSSAHPRSPGFTEIFNLACSHLFFIRQEALGRGCTTLEPTGGAVEGVGNERGGPGGPPQHQQGHEVAPTTPIKGMLRLILTLSLDNRAQPRKECEKSSYPGSKGSFHLIYHHELHFGLS